MKNSGQILSLRAHCDSKREPPSGAKRDFWQQVETGEIIILMVPLGLKLYGLVLNLHLALSFSEADPCLMGLEIYSIRRAFFNKKKIKISYVYKK